MSGSKQGVWARVKGEGGARRSAEEGAGEGPSGHEREAVTPALVIPFPRHGHGP